METVTPSHYPDDVKSDALGDEKKIEDVAGKKFASDEEAEAAYVEVPELEAKRILAKVDYRLVPVLSLLYLVAFVDRSNSKCFSTFTLTQVHQGQSEMQRLLGSLKI